MKQPFKIYAAALCAFSLGFWACLEFMTADFGSLPEERLASLPADTEKNAAAPAPGAGESQEAGESRGGEILPVLVIDAGHGGFDGGAQAADGTEEKNINLDIARQLAALAADCRVEVQLTREGDYGLYEEGSSSKKREDLEKRKEMMEQTGACLAVSIHLNSYPQDTSVYGAQVFFAEEEDRKLAEAVQQSLETHIADGRERTAMKKNDVLLLQNPPCPILLVECGFLSNPAEAEKLQSAAYQQLLAEAIWEGIHRYMCFEKKEVLPVIDSANKSAEICG